MIIDFHTHIFPEKIALKTIEHLESLTSGKASTDGTINGLLKQMEKANADISICLPVLTKPSQYDSVLKFAIEVNELFKNVKGRKLISFAGIHPLCEDIEGKMKLIKDSGIKGVKIHPDYQETPIDHEGYIRILKSAKENDLIVVTHSGIDDGYKDKSLNCPPDLVKKVIKEVDHKKFVLGHYGAHAQWEEVFEKLCGEDVYFDTAFTLHEIDEELFKKILFKHGEDKVLFATDCPWRDMGEDVDTLKSYDLPKETLDKIFYKNALELLGL